MAFSAKGSGRVAHYLVCFDCGDVGTLVEDVEGQTVAELQYNSFIALPAMKKLCLEAFPNDAELRALKVGPE